MYVWGILLITLKHEVALSPRVEAVHTVFKLFTVFLD